MRAVETPWAMQFVVRVERVEPPRHSDVCELTATATLRLLTDERARPGGEWAGPVQRWLAGRIRKHVRRARGAAWHRVAALDGVTVARDGAEVRALLPYPLDALPRDLARLQLEGLELEDPARRPCVDAVADGPVVASICPHPVLPTGKAAAAAAHAAQLAAGRMSPARLARWAAAGFPVSVEHPDADRWPRLRATAPVEIVDAGYTVVEPNTTTALARWA